MSDYDDAYAQPSGPAPMSPAMLAERYVLGAIMSDPKVLRDVQAEITPADFEDLRLGGIYRGIVGMVLAKEPIDFLSVADHLADWDVRGVDFAELGQWVSEVPSSANVAYYARMVRQASVKRKTDEIATTLLNAPDPAIAVATSITRLVEIRDRDADDQAAPMQSLREILAVPEEEDVYDWTIPDILERGDRMMLTGTEGTGKSTLLRQMGLLPAAGLHPFTFLPIEKPMRVLVIDAENSERQWRRAVRRPVEHATMFTQNPLDNVHVKFIRKSDITQAQTLGELHRAMDACEPDIVIIGPLYRLAPGAINDDDDATPVLNALDSLRDRGVSMIIEAHAGKGKTAGGERDLAPRGSAALIGWPEIGIGLSRDKERVGSVTTYSLRRWRGDREYREHMPHQLVRGTQFQWEKHR